MPKTRKPVADYITFEQYQNMLATETDPMFKLLYRVMYGFMLRVSEVVGQSNADVTQLLNKRIESGERIKKILADPQLSEEYRRNHKGKDAKIGKRLWQGALPGIRRSDIDAVKPADVGLECAHTLRVYRKMGKFEIMPFNDLQLYNDLMQFLKDQEWLAQEYNTFFDQYNLQMADSDKWVPLIKEGEQRIFPVLRQRVLSRMNRYGSTVGGMTKIHPHSLRRGGGIHMRATGRLDLEDLQNIYSHSNMSQTLAYIGIDKKTAFNKFAKAQGGSS